MAPRVTDLEVFEIITTTLTDIDVFINTANMLVNGYLSDASLTDEVLKEIERYLSAHVLSVNDQRVKSEKVDVLSTTYTGTFGMGLNMTQYGQMTILLDTSGTLGRIAKNGYKAVASLSVIGYID